MPRVVAHAVVREDPPRVFIANDEATLNWVLAIRLVAESPLGYFSEYVRSQLRKAIMQERWGDAVQLWVERSGIAVDFYPSTELFMASDVAMSEVEVQFTTLFQELEPCDE